MNTPEDGANQGCATHPLVWTAGFIAAIIGIFTFVTGIQTLQPNKESRSQQPPAVVILITPQPTQPPIVVTSPPQVVTAPPIVVTSPPQVVTAPPIVMTSPPVVITAPSLPFPPTAKPPQAQAQASCSREAGPSFSRLWDRGRLGCPIGNEQGIVTAYESFQRGWMLWRQDNTKHYALYSSGTFTSYLYPQSQPPEFACNEAQAKGRPRRGFSQVWCGNADVRSQIGDATGDEIGDYRPVQEFEQGFMIYVKERGTVVTVYNNGTWTERQ